MIDDEDHDRDRARRRWSDLMAEIDAEIREEATPEYQAQRAHDAERRRRWLDVQSSRTPQGVPTFAMTDEQTFRADLEGR